VKVSPSIQAGTGRPIASYARNLEPPTVHPHPRIARADSMLALRHRSDPTPPLAPLGGLVVRRETRASAMAVLQQRAELEMQRRIDDGHLAYVAYLNDTPAAFGWVATRSAELGELRSTFAIPNGERYLWNFVTVASFRGLGIYPRLVDAIVRAESREAERFWIAYAPENHASGAGIRKAGFTTLAELSFDAAGRPALRPMVPGAARIASRLLGLPEASDTLTPCWRCVRAGRGAMYCAPGECRCDYQVPASGCAA
jgi:ribosomal protein S18 acetylase RimI-like enzyme